MGEPIVKEVALPDVEPEVDEASALFIADSGFGARYNLAAGDEQAQRAALVEFIVAAVIERTAASARALEIVGLLATDDDATWELMRSAAQRVRLHAEVDERDQVRDRDQLVAEYAEALRQVAHPEPVLPEGAELVTVTLVHDERGRLVGRTTALKPKP